MPDLDERPYGQLARWLCASVVAYQLGISIHHCLNRYVKGDPGPFWHKLAEEVMDRATIATATYWYVEAEPR